MSNLWIKEVETDLDWRIAEIGSLKLAISSSIRGSPRERALMRAFIAMLYAHIEGFVKFAVSVYANRIYRGKYQISRLILPLQYLALKKHVASAKSASSAAIFFERVRDIESRMEGNFPHPNNFPSTSNLWFSTFQNICSEVGIDVSSLDRYKRHINRLLAQRNSIAHGEKLSVVGRDTAFQLERETTAFLTEFAIAIVEALKEERFFSPLDSKPESSLATQ